jgi:tripartite-type tricarboxylate transporter receptor subunit TctC
MIRRSLVIAGLAALALGAVNDAALAQFYKGKTITMIINYPAGGPSDIEGRIIAQHLPAHLPGKPTIIIKNVGGAGGVIGTNQLGEAAPNGETMGFFTLDIIAQLLSNPALRVNYADFVMIAGVENPLVAYARKDIPPGLKVATDIMKTKDFKALSLNVQNSNTLNQALSLDLLGLKYQAVPAFRGLKEVETAILQNEGQFANTSLPGWRGSIESSMGNIVMPLWQIAARAKDGSYPRSPALPDLPTFEEFYASVNGGKKPSGFMYEVLRASSDPLVAMFRTAMMPPKTPSEPVTIMRSAFVELWKDRDFIRDYANVVKTTPILVKGEEAQEIVAALASVKPEVKAILLRSTDLQAAGSRDRTWRAAIAGCAHLPPDSAQLPASTASAANAEASPTVLRAVMRSRRTKMPSSAATMNPICVIGTSTLACPSATLRNMKMVAPRRRIAAMAL